MGKLGVSVHILAFFLLALVRWAFGVGGEARLSLAVDTEDSGSVLTPTAGRSSG